MLSSATLHVMMHKRCLFISIQDSPRGIAKRFYSWPAMANAEPGLTFANLSLLGTNTDTIEDPTTSLLRTKAKRDRERKKKTRDVTQLDIPNASVPVDLMSSLGTRTTSRQTATHTLTTNTTNAGVEDYRITDSGLCHPPPCAASAHWTLVRSLCFGVVHGHARGS